ncbi:threonylcarbamoyl-AMP synthase [Paenibacillus sp. PK3_47]|uniref:L-threonylcarbamoyladenylate synthase n=1 Tax=Paenibacillus sp. PK3_47 TaxID=2072642 RepID=UPI00201E5A67|nr:L-threonylcarbamoyladenylate synthase [Paenibacillus sp. PK3_47]UQZ33892.1 threonylcarbamoyl-AMP synthase [Paenibacillus sp. PK3_47]
MNERHDQPFAAQRRSGTIDSTVYWKLDGAEAGVSFPAKHSGNDQDAITAAAAMLLEGETVAFPTETVYGLGADARNTSAVEAVFAAKGRPSDNPLIVHVASREAVDVLVAEVHPVAEALMDAFWPGPLTVVLPVRPDVLSPLVTAGLDTVGVRMPDHPVALALLRAAGCPVAAPSANRSGRPSPTTAAHVMEDLAGYIGGVLDGGAAGVGLESTVVQVRPDGTVAVLRPGGITAEQLAAVCGPGAVDAAPGAEVGFAADAGKAGAGRAGSVRAGGSPAPRAPGMKYTHYAPQGWLGVVRGSSPLRVAETAAGLLQAAQRDGEVTGLLLFEEHRDLYPAVPAACVASLGSLSSPEEAGRSLYAALRRFDEAGATYILAEACPETGLGAAIMNRLMKAAGGSVIDAV